MFEGSGWLMDLYICSFGVCLSTCSRQQLSFTIIHERACWYVQCMCSCRTQKDAIEACVREAIHISQKTTTGENGLEVQVRNRKRLHVDDF